MNSNFRTALWALLAITLTMSAAITQTKPTFQYAVKLICGSSKGEIIATGVYRTAINIHNPGDTAVMFKAKFAQAPPGGKPGVVTKWRQMSLGADQATEIDCADVFKWLETNATFLKGFVVIESSFELDVVAVYTAAGSDGEVRSLEMERVNARRLTTR